MDTITRCVGCGYWKKTDWKDGFGECHGPHVKDHDDDKSYLKGDDIILGADGCWSYYTGPQYGCVHGKAKTQMVK